MWPWRTRKAAAIPQRCVVIDVETTGLDTSRDELLAVAGIAVAIEGPRCSVLLADSIGLTLQAKPARLNKENILLHGIGVGETSAGLAPAAALAALEAWLGGSVVLGYHVGFDRAILNTARGRHALPPLPNAWVDLAAVAPALLDEGKDVALDDWLQRLAIPCLQRHQAAADTLATCELLQHLWPLAWRDGARHPKDLIRLAQRSRWL